jgi:hypothetical protein
MPLLGDCRGRQSDADNGQQGCRSRRERTVANPDSGDGLDGVHGSTAKVRKELGD